MPEVAPSKYLVMAGWDDVPHLSEKAKAELLASTPPHLRDARSKGIPAMGSGRIFTTDENALKVAPFPIPAYWPRLSALDFGWNHPTAAVWLAFDMDADTIYITDTYRESETTVPVHASAIRRRGAWIPCAWPHDGLQHDKHAGEQLAEQYRQEGVNMLAEMARYPEGHKINGTSIASRTSVEAGIWDMQTRMEQGRLKVFANQDKWFEEYRLYHREDGAIVKLFDDLMCLHPDTTVLTDAGPRPIRSLVGTTGRVVTTGGVLADYHSCRLTRKDADLVRVTFSDGFELLCTPDHKLLSSSGDWVEAIHFTGLGCHRAQGGALSVLRVQSAGKSDVYCMEVPGFHAFALENGAVVHNCATRYGVMMKRFAIVEPQPKRLRDDKARRSANSWKV